MCQSPQIIPTKIDATKTEFFFSKIGCKKLLQPISSPKAPINIPVIIKGRKLVKFSVIFTLKFSCFPMKKEIANKSIGKINAINDLVKINFSKQKFIRAGKSL